MKKALSLLVAVIMVLSMFPVTALADETEYYDLWVVGTRVSSDNCEDVFEDGRVSYDSDNNTLTLSGANLTATDDHVISYTGPEELTLVLSGTNAFSSKNASSIYSSVTNIVIRGSGTLKIETNKTAVYCKGLELDGANVTVDAGSGFYSDGSIGPDEQPKPKSARIIVKNKSSLTMRTNQNCLNSGKIVIDDSTVNLSSSKDQCIYSTFDTHISSGSDVSFKSNNAAGITTYRGFYIDSSSLDIESRYTGIDQPSALYPVSMTDSDITIVSGLYGISSGRIEADGCKLDISSGEDSLYAFNNRNNTGLNDVVLNDCLLNLESKNSGSCGIKTSEAIILTNIRDGSLISSTDSCINAHYFEPVSIKDSGKITLTSKSGYGIYSYKGVNVTGSELDITSSSQGIFASESDINISGADIKVSSNHQGIVSKAGNINISNGSELDIESARTGINSGKNAEISDSTIKVKSTEDRYDGIYADKAMTISGCTLNIECVSNDPLYNNSGNCLYTRDGDMLINDTEAFLSSTGNSANVHSIYSYENVIISGSDISCQSGYKCIEVKHLTVTDSVVTMKAGNMASNDEPDLSGYPEAVVDYGPSEETAKIEVDPDDADQYYYKEKYVKILPGSVYTLTITDTEYNAETHPVTVCINGVETDTGVEYIGTLRDGTEYATTTDAPVNAGTYTATVIDRAGRPVSIEYTISPRPVAITWSDLEFEYDANEHVPTATLTNLATDSDVVTLVITPARTDAGEYTAKVTVMSSSNYTAESGTNLETDWAIVPRVVELSWTGTDFVYDGKGHVPTASVTNLATDSDVVNVTVIATETDAGEYVATATSLDNPNYTLESATDTETDWKIERRQARLVPLKGQGKTRGRPDGTLMYRVEKIDGVEESGLAEGDELNGKLNREEGEMNGRYYYDFDELIEMNPNYDFVEIDDDEYFEIRNVNDAYEIYIPAHTAPDEKEEDNPETGAPVLSVIPMAVVSLAAAVTEKRK